MACGMCTSSVGANGSEGERLPTNRWSVSRQITAGQRRCSKRIRSNHNASSQVGGRKHVSCRSKGLPDQRVLAQNGAQMDRAERRNSARAREPGAEVRWFVGQP